MRLIGLSKVICLVKWYIGVHTKIFISTFNDSVMTYRYTREIGRKGGRRRAKKVKKNLIYKRNLSVYYKYEKVKSAL